MRKNLINVRKPSEKVPVNFTKHLINTHKTSLKLFSENFHKLNAALQLDSLELESDFLGQARAAFPSSTPSFAADAHRRLARKGTHHAPHASVDGEGIGVARERPAEGPAGSAGGERGASTWRAREASMTERGLRRRRSVWGSGAWLAARDAASRRRWRGRRRRERVGQRVVTYEISL